MTRYPGIFFGLLLLAAGGCATLNESECRNADWRMIGMEDGIAGRQQSYIGKHRQACAKHGITPDMVAYQQGYSDGVKQYCTELKGFEVGKKGAAYNGVCPPESENLFLEGYHFGRQFNTVDHTIKKCSAAIHSKQKQVEKTEQEVLQKERLLISDKTTEAQRASLLAEIKELQEKIGRLEGEILETEKQRAVAQAKIDRLNRHNPYY
jgi:hypothetical protein